MKIVLPAAERDGCVGSMAAYGALWTVLVKGLWKAIRGISKKGNRTSLMPRSYSLLGRERCSTMDMAGITKVASIGLGLMYFILYFRPSENAIL